MKVSSLRTFNASLAFCDWVGGFYNVYVVFVDPPRVEPRDQRLRGVRCCRFQLPPFTVEGFFNVCITFVIHLALQLTINVCMERVEDLCNVYIVFMFRLALNLVINVWVECVAVIRLVSNLAINVCVELVEALCNFFMGCFLSSSC